MRNNVVKKVLAATLACMMTFSMTTVAQAKGDKNSDKEITIGVTSFADTLESGITAKMEKHGHSRSVRA